MESIPTAKPDMATVLAGKIDVAADVVRAAGLPEENLTAMFNDIRKQIKTGRILMAAGAAVLGLGLYLNHIDHGQKQQDSLIGVFGLASLMIGASRSDNKRAAIKNEIEQKIIRDRVEMNNVTSFQP